MTGMHWNGHGRIATVTVWPSRRVGSVQPGPYAAMEMDTCQAQVHFSTPNVPENCDLYTGALEYCSVTTKKKGGQPRFIYAGWCYFCLFEQFEWVAHESTSVAMGGVEWENACLIPISMRYIFLSINYVSFNMSVVPNWYFIISNKRMFPNSKYQCNEIVQNTWNGILNFVWLNIHLTNNMVAHWSSMEFHYYISICCDLLISIMLYLKLPVNYWVFSYFFTFPNVESHY